jgi:hypothetical protein
LSILNEEGVPGPFKQGKKWSPSAIHRMLTSEKYIGRWIWNRTGTRRDPKTGTRRRYEKPESEWIVHEDESLRIIPNDLWKAVRTRKEATRNTWPGGKGKRGFSDQQQEIGRLRSNLPQTMKLKEADLASEQRKLENFIEAIGEGRGSKALAKALTDTERRVESLQEAVEAFKRPAKGSSRLPPARMDRGTDLEGLLGLSHEFEADRRPQMRLRWSKPPSPEVVGKGVRALCDSGGAEIRTRIRGRGARVSTGLAGA